MSVGIITSAAPINPEMAVEFGPLPPAFLPVGGTRLFRYQAALLHKLADRVVLTLPGSFIPSAHDARLLADLQIEVLQIPDGLPLGESVMLAMIQSIVGNEPVVILHGDTLFRGLEGFPADAISVHHRDHPYSWAVVGGTSPLSIRAVGDERDPAIVSGLFSFSQGAVFLKCLARASKDFIAALNTYAAAEPAFAAVENCGEWLDLGHLNTYFASRRCLTTERTFNALVIERDAVVKSSAQTDKMEAEASWFENLPVSLAATVPAYLGRTQTGYRLAYEYLSPLSDLYVFGALPAKVWRAILTSCAGVLEQFRAVKPAVIDPRWSDWLYAGKTIERFARFARAHDFSAADRWHLNGTPCPSPEEIITRLSGFIGRPSEEECGILHGDFCFSNILFDFRRRGVKLIDPRGYVHPGKPDLFGDTRYDIGKLHHSVFGGYDLIVAGYCDARRSGPRALDFSVAPACGQAVIEDLFAEIICGGDPRLLKVAAAISVLLFFAMLPLHGDDPARQWALFANAFRLHRRFFGDQE